MKNSNLKSLIQNLVKEAIADKIGEGQPVGGVKNDHPFDAGRHNVMKAVNVAENNDDRPCDCGSGESSEWEMDGQGIPLVRACSRCRKEKLKKFRPEILRPYSQADVDEPIEPDYQEEGVGFDGKYVDDMESGVAVKKLHGLDEAGVLATTAMGAAGFAAGTLIYRTLKDIIKRSMASKDASKMWAAPLTEKKINLMMVVVKSYNPKLKDDDIEYIKQASLTAFKNGTVKNTGQLLNYLKDVANMPPKNMNEMTGTGAVAGYSTPFAFSKNKQGSSRAIASAKKYGTVVKSISEKKK